MREFLFSRTGVVVAGLLAVAGYFLWLEHSALIISNLPLVLVGACLAMHIFMHRDHGNHTEDADAPDQAGTKPGDRHD